MEIYRNQVLLDIIGQGCSIEAVAGETIENNRIGTMAAVAHTHTSERLQIVATNAVFSDPSTIVLFLSLYTYI